MAKRDRGAEGPTDLEGLFERIERAAKDEDPVTFRRILEELGARSFAPLLLLAGLITLAPVIGDVPGVPTLMGVTVLLTAGQMLLRRERIWLPGFVLERSVKQERLEKGLSWLRRPARFVDKLLRPRLTWLTDHAGRMAIGVTCVVIALAMPPMEIVPFTANGAGLVLTTFGLALVAHDGAVALVSYLLTAGLIGVLAYALL